MGITIMAEIPADHYLLNVHQFGATFVMTCRRVDKTVDVKGSHADLQKALKHMNPTLTKAEVMAKYDIPDKYYDRFDEERFFSVFFAQYDKPLRMVAMSRQDFYAYTEKPYKAMEEPFFISQHNTLITSTELYAITDTPTFVSQTEANEEGCYTITWNVDGITYTTNNKL